MQHVIWGVVHSMTIPATVIAKLATLGLSAEQAEAVAGMLSTVEAATAEHYEAMAEASRAKARARVQKWRERNVTERHETSRNGLRVGDARGEVKNSNSEIKPQEKKDTRSGEFRDALRAVLDEERLNALVKHRHSRKAPLTAYAARLFIKAAEDCGISVAEATDHCIERNWLTVKPSWIAKPAPRGSPPMRMDDFLGTVIEQQERRNAGPHTEIEGAPQALRAIPGGRWSG